MTPLPWPLAVLLAAALATAGTTLLARLRQGVPAPPPFPPALLYLLCWLSAFVRQ